MLVAGCPERLIQPLDVRDLVASLLGLIESQQTGRFNAVAPQWHATHSELVDACSAVTGGMAQPVWVEPGWLTGRGVSEWTELVLWRSAPGTWAVDGGRAHGTGLVCRPVGETVADTHAWLQHERPIPHPRAAEHGLDALREAELLDAWDAELARRG
jgi:hypothetical protein